MTADERARLTREAKATLGQSAAAIKQADLYTYGIDEKLDLSRRVVSRAVSRLREAGLKIEDAA